MVMELWDLYDKDGKRTGEVWERRHGNYLDIPDGRYHLVSDRHSSAKVPRSAPNANCLKKRVFCATALSLSKSP